MSKAKYPKTLYVKLAAYADGGIVARREPEYYVSLGRTALVATYQLVGEVQLVNKTTVGPVPTAKPKKAAAKKRKIKRASTTTWPPTPSPRKPLKRK